MLSKLNIFSRVSLTFIKQNFACPGRTIGSCKAYSDKNHGENLPPIVVSKKDLSMAFSSLLRYEGNEQSMGKLLESIDIKKKGVVDQNQLAMYVERMKLPKIEQIKSTISRAGVYKDKLNKSDLRKILGWEAPDWPSYDSKEDAIEELLSDGIKIFDSDKDGLLSADEFVELYACLLFVASIVTP